MLVSCRELKRVRDESGCRFHDRKVLNERYLMGNLLGKGGFSDVYLVLSQPPFPLLPPKDWLLACNMASTSMIGISATGVQSL